MANLAAIAAGGSLALQNGRNLTTPGHFDNAGSLVLGSTDTFTVRGAYSQAFGGTLATALGGTMGGTDFGQLVVEGTASLDGTLAVSLIECFVPGPADRFEIVRYGSRSGDFDSATGLLVPNGLVLDRQFGVNGLELVATGTATNSIPRADDDSDCPRGHGEDVWRAGQRL